MARKGEPWYRTGKNCWYVWHRGKLVRLHRERAEAFPLWHLLLAGTRPPTQTEPSPQPPPVPGPALTVRQLVDAYLTEAALRVRPSTLLSKQKVLLRLKAQKW